MKQAAHTRAVRGLAGLRSAARAVSVMCVVSAVPLTGCTELLTPDNPDEILAEDLKDPKALPILLAGVAGDYNYMYSYAIVTTGHFANELWHTGSQGGWRELNRGIADPQGQMGTVYDRAVKANWVADNAAALIEEVFPDAQSKPELARSRIYAGFAQLMLADNFCAATINGGPALTPAATYQAALDNFTDALAVAAAASQDVARAQLAGVYRLQALAGRARANLMLRQYQAARDDAVQIPANWRFQAIYSLNSSREENFVPSHTVARFRKEGGVDPRYFENPLYATDLRLNFINMGPDTVGEDRLRQFVQQTKYRERNSPANIASWQEARLIEAEAELELGNTDSAIALINQVRAAAPCRPTKDACVPSLAPYAGPTTKDEVRKQILFERSVELFLEAKHLADLRRSQSPLLADRTDCGPISWVEQNSNPNLR